MYLELATEIVAWWVAVGKVDMRNGHGQTTLHNTCSQGNLDVAEMFLRGGASASLSSGLGCLLGFGRMSVYTSLTCIPQLVITS